MPVQVVGCEQARYRLAFAVSWRHKDHQAADRPVRYLLQNLYELVKVRVKLELWCDLGDELPKGQRCVTLAAARRRLRECELSYRQ